MSRFLKLISSIFILGCLTCGCSSQAQPTPITIPIIDLTPLTSGILSSDEINTSGLLKVDEGLITSDLNNCPAKECAISVWNILEPDLLGFMSPNSGPDIVISLGRYQTPEDAISNADKTSRAGDPGIRIIAIPIETLPKHSWAEAEDGRLVVLSTVYGNIHVGISLSEQTWKINEPEKAVALMANIAKLQIDKLALSTKK